MMLDTTQSLLLMLLGFLSIAILLRILIVVHRQYGRVKELEMRMNAIENMDADQLVATQIEQKEN